MKLRSLALLAVFLLALVAFSHSAQAAEPTSFDSVRLLIYPEYDDPRLLVMLEGKIVGTKPPATVRFLVPTAAEMYSAGSLDPQGKYTGGPPNRVASSIPGWDEISYDVKTEVFRVEYYDPIVPILPEKTIAYDFRTLYPINTLRVIVQQPRASSNFVVKPEGGSPTSADGFPGLIYQLSDVTKDKPVHFDLSYVKPDPRPSIEPTATPAAAKTQPNTALGPAMVILLGAAVVGGFIWVLSSRKPAKRRPAPAPARTPKTAAGQKNRFCTQCGEAIGVGARFCSGCGAKQRD